MFDIGFFEFVALGVIALLVFGPDRLPKVTAQAAHWMRQFRDQAAAARQQITESIEIDPGMLKDLSDLHPRNLARSVMEPIEDVKAAGTQAMTGSSGSPSGPSTPPAPAPKPDAVPFDPDAT